MAKQMWRDVGRYGSVGIELVLSIALGFWLGRVVDSRVHGHGIVTIFGVVVGVYAGFRSLYKAAVRAQKDFDRQEEEEKRQKEEWLAKGRDPTHDDDTSRAGEKDEPHDG
jgi:ATP synthase protein I